jgi:hypothetical protein
MHGPTGGRVQGDQRSETREVYATVTNADGISSVSSSDTFPSIAPRSG